MKDIYFWILISRIVHNAAVILLFTVMSLCAWKVSSGRTMKLPGRVTVSLLFAMFLAIAVVPDEKEIRTLLVLEKVDQYISANHESDIGLVENMEMLSSTMDIVITEAERASRRER